MYEQRLKNKRQSRIDKMSRMYSIKTSSLEYNSEEPAIKNPFFSGANSTMNKISKAFSPIREMINTQDKMK